jgi:hypothetical protein
VRRVFLLRYKTKPQHAAENERLVRAVFDEIQLRRANPGEHGNRPGLAPAACVQRAGWGSRSTLLTATGLPAQRGKGDVLVVEAVLGRPMQDWRSPQPAEPVGEPLQRLVGLLLG